MALSGKGFPYAWNTDPSGPRRPPAARRDGGPDSLGRGGAVLRLPPAQRLRPAGRAGRARRRPSPADVRRRHAGPERGRAPPDALDARSGERPRAARSRSTIAASSSRATTSGCIGRRHRFGYAAAFDDLRHGPALQVRPRPRDQRGPRLRHRPGHARARLRPPRARRRRGRRLGHVLRLRRRHRSQRRRDPPRAGLHR